MQLSSDSFCKLGSFGKERSLNDLVNLLHPPVESIYKSSHSSKVPCTGFQSAYLYGNVTVQKQGFIPLSRINF